MNAIKIYNDCPNVCKFCSKGIQVINGRVFDARHKVFCSKSCAASFNNKGIVRNKVSSKNTCSCGKKKSKIAKQCSSCFKGNYYEKTLSELLGVGMYSTVRLNHVRKHARAILEKSGIEKKCVMCSNREFDSVVQACHIEGIMEFDLKSKVKDFNKIENLVWLCPSHHKMLDNKTIKLTPIPSPL